MTDTKSNLEHVLRNEFGSLMDVPSPKCVRPLLWHFETRNRERRLVAAIFDATGLREITQDMRDRYWAEVRKGQDVYEDAGGYRMRCFEVMCGLYEPGEVQTHEAFAKRLIAEGILDD